MDVCILLLIHLYKTFFQHYQVVTLHPPKALKWGLVEDGVDLFFTFCLRSFRRALSLFCWVKVWGKYFRMLSAEFITQHAKHKEECKMSFDRKNKQPILIHFDATEGKNLFYLGL